MKNEKTKEGSIKSDTVNMDMLKSVLEAEDVDVFVVSVILGSIFGSMDWLEYEPSAIDSWLNDTLGIEVSTALSDKIQTAATIIGTDYFFRSVDMFMKFCLVMSNKDLSPNSFIPPSYIDIVTGVIYVNLLRGNDNIEKYDANIIAYINLSKKVAGIRKTPEVLEFTKNEEELTSIDIDGSLDSRTMWEIQEERFADLLGNVKEKILVDYKVLSLINLDGVEIPDSLLSEYDRLQEERSNVE